MGQIKRKCTQWLLLCIYVLISQKKPADCVLNKNPNPYIYHFPLSFLYVSPATDSEQTECVMCGKTTANMQCPTCSGLRCKSCDNQWHLHPSRRSHQRKELEASPAFPPIIYCNVCGQERATVLCSNCSSSFCSQHDVLVHQHPLRMTHTRQPLVIDSESPTVESPPKNIVLSPVDTLSRSQDSQRTPDSRSLAVFHSFW